MGLTTKQQRTRKAILDIATDLMGNFLYYDRKESDIGIGDIEQAINEGVVTVEEILAIFERALRSRA